VRSRSLTQQSFQAHQLRRSKLRRPVRMGLGIQGVWPAGDRPTPTIQRRSILTEVACHPSGSLSAVDQLDGTPPPPFKFLRSSKRSAQGLGSKGRCGTVAKHGRLSRFSDSIAAVGFDLLRQICQDKYASVWLPCNVKIGAFADAPQTTCLG